MAPPSCFVCIIRYFPGIAAQHGNRALLINIQYCTILIEMYAVCTIDYMHHVYYCGREKVIQNSYTQQLVRVRL